MVYKFFNKKTAGSGVTTLVSKSAIKSIPQNEQLAMSHLLKNFRKEKYIQLLKIISGLQIRQICS